ncbi:MAG: hypothetical protein KGL53_02590, partial [Elusimicrobia bacterium]|nr:hypothetical protein [Elusimicrobiota bacterium]
MKEAVSANDDLHDKELELIQEAGPVPPPNFDQWLHDQLEPYRARRDAIMQEAIDGTLVAYGILPAGDDGKPIMPTGDAVDPLLKHYGLDGPVTWKVVFRAPPPTERVVAAGHWTVHGTIPPLVQRLSADDIRQHNGVTTPDGVTFIWPDFGYREKDHPEIIHTMSAPALARLLFHELNHFRLKTSKTTAGALGQNEEEVRVCDKDLKEMGN